MAPDKKLIQIEEGLLKCEARSRRATNKEEEQTGG